jgi:hypothetical protein
MLRIDAASGKREILELLFEIANGCAEPGDAVSYSTLETPFPHYIPNQHGGLVEPLSIACRSAVLGGFSTFIKELHEAEVDIKEKALGLLCSFGEHHYVIRTALSTALEKEANPSFRTKIANALNAFCR